MRILEEIKPERVFYYFEEISKIPRGSYNTGAISDYCVNFAKAKGLRVIKDKYNNCIIFKEASKGRQMDTPVIIQGHMDMVCEKTIDSTHDFLRDGIELLVENGFVTAKDTTLGADDGIAVAMALAILEDDTISHPDLEVIFTVDEEVGMDGAKNIDLSQTKGKYVLNLDCDMEAMAFAGCAGGVRGDFVFNVTKEKVKGAAFQIEIKGLVGGHSGSEIDKERANSNILLGRLLQTLDENIAFDIVSLEGGTKDNVITNYSKAVITNVTQVDRLEQLIKESNQIFLNEYAVSDNNIKIDITRLEAEQYEIINKEAKQDILFFMNTVPNGAINYSQDIRDIVETSLNMGVLKTNENNISIGISVRSLVKSRKEYIMNKLKLIAKKSNAVVSVYGDYPQWDYNRKSTLQKTVAKSYKDLFGEDLKITVIHAGLECGYLLEKRPDLDILSFGPQMYDIHTVNERLSIESTEKVYKLVLKILEEVR